MSALSALWRITFEPIYRRLFRRYFQATIDRLDTTLGYLNDLRSDVRSQGVEVTNQTAAILSHSAAISDYGVELRNHIHGLNVRLDTLTARFVDLESQVRTLTAAHWEQEAIARRIASLEDRIESRDPSSSGA